MENAFLWKLVSRTVWAFGLIVVGVTMEGKRAQNAPGMQQLRRVNRFAVFS